MLGSITYKRKLENERRERLAPGNFDFVLVDEACFVVVTEEETDAY